MIQTAVAGLASGGAYAVLGLSLTLTYRTTRTVNFTVAAVGAFGAFALGWVDGRAPLAVAVPVGVLAGAALGLLLGLVQVTWFGTATTEVRSVVSVASLIILLAGAGLIWEGNPQPVPVPSSLTSPAIRIGGTPVSGATLLLIGIAIVVALATGLLLARTRAGRRLQAVSERPDTCDLLGISSRRYGLFVWGATGAFNVLAVWLVSSRLSTVYSSLSFMVVPALAAALLGLFRHLGWTVVGGVALGVLQGYFAGNQTWAPYSPALPFLVLLVVLMYSQRGERWDEAR